MVEVRILLGAWVISCCFFVLFYICRGRLRRQRHVARYPLEYRIGVEREEEARVLPRAIRGGEYNASGGRYYSDFASATTYCITVCVKIASNMVQATGNDKIPYVPELDGVLLKWLHSVRFDPYIAFSNIPVPSDLSCWDPNTPGIEVKILGCRAATCQAQHPHSDYGTRSAGSSVPNQILPGTRTAGKSGQGVRGSVEGEWGLRGGRGAGARTRE
ncbi:hypothetical protein DFH09DRAFT_1292823 [Mycena vulgaris]|nr:hypothetical protein DFH09DRAFT_1292823 [Mycena vulgaris]